MPEDSPVAAESEEQTSTIAPDTLAFVIGNILKQSDANALHELPQAAIDDVNEWVELAGPQTAVTADSSAFNAKYDAYLDYMENNPQATTEQTASYKAALLLTTEVTP